MRKMPVIAGTLLVVGLLGVIGAIAAWKYHDLHKPGEPPMMPPQAIDIVKAESVPWQPTATLVGTVVAKRSVTLANEIAGTVTEVNFESGDLVEPGKVLVQQDLSSENADLAAAEAAQRSSAAAIDVAKADIRAAEATRDWAKGNQQRFKDAGGAVSTSDLERANADLRKADADLERGQSSLTKAQTDLDASKARVEQIKTRIAKKTLKSPFRARASIRTVHPGQYLAEGTTIVSLLEVTDDIYLDFAVPQEYSTRVVPGAVVIASSNVLGTKDLHINVISMDAMVNPTTRNVRIRASVADPEHKLRQGMAIDVEVPTEPVRPCVVVPNTAVRRAAFGDHVFVLTKMDPVPNMPPMLTAHQRMVTLGADLGGKVIVQSGLKEGEEIAAAGSFKLHEGATVFQGPPPQSAPPGAPAGEATPSTVSSK
jgi:membrane fusion protein, multidrug efflux system